MIKRFCDRCNKEVEYTRKILIPCEKTSCMSFSTTPMSVCCDCENKFYNIIDKLIDIKFILFNDFMKEEG